MPSGLFYLKSLDKSISYIRDGWLVFGLGLACQAKGQSSHTKISTPARAFTEK